MGAVEVTRLADPPGGVAEVDSAAGSAGLTTEVAAYGATRTVGAVDAAGALAAAGLADRGPGDGSTANEASVVLLAEVAGVRFLLTGDVEPEGQHALARALPGLRVDVLKVPHHGSRYQDLAWLDSLGAAPRGGLGRRGQRLRPPGRRRRSTTSPRTAPRCCAPTVTATSWSPSATGVWSPSTGR